MLEILRQFLEYARFKLTDVGFGVFVYLARHVSDLFSGTFKNDEHILLGISSLAKFVDTRVFLISEMEAAGIYIFPPADSILKNREFVPGKNPEEATLIRLTVADLGFKSSATTDQIYERAQILGLELCPADTGPNYCLKYRNQPLNAPIYIGMKQITDSSGRPNIFEVYRQFAMTLRAAWMPPRDKWDPEEEFVFRLRKLAPNF